MERHVQKKDGVAATPVGEPDARRPDGAWARIDEVDLKRRVAEVLDRWPAAGVGVAVVRDGSPAWFFGHGVSDIESKEPIAEDTVFRIGSITKTVTAIAVMQLSEEGLVDLDAPANDYLRSFRLVPAKPSFRPTVRHLLTHTAGVGYWRRLSELLRPGVGWADRAPRSGVEPLAESLRHSIPYRSSRPRLWEEMRPWTKLHAR